MNRIGVSKANTVVEIQLLEHCVREDLNKRALRVMAVLSPLKVVIENWPGPTASGSSGWRRSTTPKTRAAGTRQMPFSGELYVEPDDYREDAPRAGSAWAPAAKCG